MKKDRYDFICMEAEAGRDTFAIRPSTQEEGIVSSCVPTTEHLIVETAKGEKRCWDFHECEEISRNKDEWPRR